MRRRWTLLAAVALACLAPGAGRAGDGAVYKPHHYRTPWLLRYCSGSLVEMVRIDLVPQWYPSRFDRRAEMMRILRESEEPQERLTMIRRLVLYKEERIADCLLRHLGDSHMEVRETAIWALGQLGFKKAVKPLIDSFEGNPRRVRLTLGQSLAKLTGVDYGTAHRRWQLWYDANRQMFR